VPPSWGLGPQRAVARLPNGLEMSRPASSSNLHYTRFAAAGRVGSIELLGGPKYRRPLFESSRKVDLTSVRVDDHEEVA
jgi:hypothetical protein